MHLILTPEGLQLAGIVLAKRAPDGSLELHEGRLCRLLCAAFGKPLSPRALAYIKRAGELMAEVKDSDWDNRTPHHVNNVPALSKANMMIALAGFDRATEEGVQRLRKTSGLAKYNFSPDQPRDEHGRWTDEDGDPEEGNTTTVTNYDLMSGNSPVAADYSNDIATSDPVGGLLVPAAATVAGAEVLGSEAVASLVSASRALLEGDAAGTAVTEEVTSAGESAIAETNAPNWKLGNFKS